MSRVSILALAAALATVGSVSVQAQAQAKVNVVAAENFYGDLAQQVGGDDVSVVSVMSNPDEDPHLFEASPQTARSLAQADVTIANGADYDPWMASLLKANSAPKRIEISVGDLAHKKAGDNPHLWYDPANMILLARRLADALSSADPGHKAEFENRERSFEASLAPIDAKIAAMRASYAGAPVTASEPVFGYMSGKVGLAMRNESFQLSVMNDTEPSASDVAAFEDDLKNHKVRVMIYNSQADDQSVKRLVAIAKSSHVPVIGVTETEPAKTTYQSWMMSELDSLDRALASSKP